MRRFAFRLPLFLFLPAVALLLVGCRGEFEEKLDRARSLFERGEPAEALAIARELLADPPEDVDDAVELADLLQKLGKEWARKAAELLRSRDLPPEGRDVLADAWFAAGDPSRAGLVVGETFERGEETARTYLIRGKLALSRRNAALAVTSLRESLERDDEDPLAWIFFAMAKGEREGPETAERLLRQAHGKFADSPEVSLALGAVILGRRGEDRAAMQEAADLFAPAVERRPRDRNSRRILGRLLRKLDRLAESEAVLEALAAEETQAGEEVADTFRELGRTRLERGKAAEAVEAFRRPVEIEPNGFEHLLNLGRALLAFSDLRARGPEAAIEAEEVYQRALRIRPEDPRPYVGIARASIKIDPKSDERAGRARAMYTRALKYDPDSFEANLGLAVLYYDVWADRGTEEGEGLRRARAHFDRAAAVVPPEEWETGARNAYREVREK